MTVAAISSRKQIFNGSGSTGPFTFNFPILDASFIAVTKYSTAGVPTTLSSSGDYTCTLVSLGLSGGSLTLTTALATGEKLVIEGSTPISQIIQYANQGGFFPEKHETSYDKLTMITQEVYDVVNRSLRVAKTSSLSGNSLELPEPEASQVIGWNAAGTGLENYLNAGDAYNGAVAAESNCAILESQVMGHATRAANDARLAIAARERAEAAAATVNAAEITAQAALIVGII